jgi:multisubunit Na+/H+ antiporter MnhG subunit
MVKTESLVPCIIAHYLIDVFGALFMNVIFGDMMLGLIYMLIFIVILAPLLNILLVRFVMKRENNLQNNQV